jgi:hypothetical protein
MVKRGICRNSVKGLHQCHSGNLLAGIHSTPSSLKASMSRASTPDENMKARKLSPDCGVFQWGSFPVISSPSWRHENLPEVCRIHSSILFGIMTCFALTPPWIDPASSQDPDTALFESRHENWLRPDDARRRRWPWDGLFSYGSVHKAD